jgi:hypothetical protein
MRYRFAAWMIQGLIFFLVRHDPFFGDAISTVSRASVHIYSENLSTIWYLPQHDPGHPTLIPYLLAMLWKLFGKHLWVGHFLTLLFALGVTTQVHRLALKTVHGNLAHLVLLLVLVQPTFLAQSAMVLTHLPLTFFFLWALNSLLYQPKHYAFWISSVLMVFTHLEGAFLLMGVGLVYFILEQKRAAALPTALQKSAILFAPAFFALFLWGGIHAQQTGWWFSSPVYAEHRSWMGLTAMLKSAVLIVWRMVDYGNITFYVIILWATLKWQLYRHPLFSYLAGAFITCSFIFAVLMSKSIAHRYFLPIHMPALVLLLLALDQLSAKYQKLACLACALSLLAGNLLYYPGKCIGDATVAYRNYFFMAQQIKSELPAYMVLYTYPPLSNPDSVTTLHEFSQLNVQAVYGNKIQDIPVVLQSNCNCEFTSEELNELTTWKGKSYEDGAVYVNVLFNPAFYPTPLLNEPLRQKSGFEQWMEKMKK